MISNGIAELQSKIDGRVHVSGDAAFPQAAQPWNLAVHQPALAVVEAAHADDVAATVRWAAAAGLSVSAQAGGHGANGDTEGAIVLRTPALDELTVRPAERVARVGAGTKWGQVLAATSPHGLTGLAGSSPVVSVVPYTLGGGLSWFSRRHGGASSSGQSFDVVLADGERAVVTAESDPELFWALCGGGGDIAVVTAMEFALHPAPELYGGRMLWPAARSAEVLAAFRAVTAVAPEGLTSWFELVQFPGGEPMVGIDVAFLGAAAEATELLRPYAELGATLADTRAPLPVAELPSITSEPTAPSPGASLAGLLTTLDDAVAQTLLAKPVEPLLSLQIRHLGGALTRPSDTAAGPLTEPYLYYCLGIPSTPERGAAVRARQQELARELAPSSSGRTPFTMLTPGKSAADAFTEEAHKRLGAIKQERNPEATIRSNYPIG